MSETYLKHNAHPGDANLTDSVNRSAWRIGLRGIVRARTEEEARGNDAPSEQRVIQARAVYRSSRRVQVVN